MRGRKPTALLAIGVAGTTLWAGTAHAALSETVTPFVAPPTQPITVAATGFAATEGVDVFFDTTDIALAATDASGTLSIPTAVPGSAIPGTHWITLLGRRDGLAVQKSFTVHTPWL